MQNSPLIPIIPSCEYHKVVKRLRDFFDSKGFVECYAQNRLSILAACEDPETISTFNYAGQVWPLPQTSQMWLEYELLKDPSVPGYYSVSTSYRNEPDPVPGRHQLIFGMFEFELKGGMDEMIKLEKELLEYLGYGKASEMPVVDYREMCKKYGVDQIDHAEEEKLLHDYGSAVFLCNFDEKSSPFWNMKRDGNIAKKVDVILDGIETIGSAERSCNVGEMREAFKNISNGQYAKTLYAQFTRDRVERELEDFFSLDFIPRSGGGIGLTRLIKSLKKQNLLNKE